MKKIKTEASLQVHGLPPPLPDTADERQEDKSKCEQKKFPINFNLTQPQPNCHVCKKCNHFVQVETFCYTRETI